MLFLVCAEVLALLLKSNQDVKGFPVKEMLKLLCQYADDADIYLLRSQKSLDTVFLILERFKRLSGFTLNYDKTTILRIGSIRQSNQMLMTQKIVSWTNEPINVLGTMVTTNEEIIEKINYEPLLSKMKSVLSNWSKRSASLFGKILIINTLIASLFVYKLTALPSMTKDMMKSIKSQITSFIWSGGKAKIKYNVLIMRKEEGGANLVDIEMKDKALKSTWIQILEHEKDLSKIVYTNNVPIIADKIWDCNLQPADVFIFITDKFWMQVFQSWFEFKQSADHISKRHNQILWMNSEIRIGGVPILWKQNAKKGLLFVKQLISNVGWISHHDAERKFGLNILQLNALKVAIPKKTIDEIKKHSSGTMEEVICFSRIMRAKKNLSQVIYNSLIKAQSFADKMDGWNKEMNTKIETESFIQWCRDNYSNTNVPKLRSFQFRLIHRAIITNKHLCKWKMRDNSLCTFCGEEKETYVHIFVMCNQVRQLWIDIEIYMESLNTEPIEFNQENVISSNLTKKRKNIKNFICTLAKQYIYRKRCNQQLPKSNELINEIAKLERIELFIAKKNGKEHQHFKKWSQNGRSLSYND